MERIDAEAASRWYTHLEALSQVSPQSVGTVASLVAICTFRRLNITLELKRTHSRLGISSPTPKWKLLTSCTHNQRAYHTFLLFVVEEIKRKLYINRHNCIYSIVGLLRLYWARAHGHAYAYCFDNVHDTRRWIRWRHQARHATLRSWSNLRFIQGKKYSSLLHRLPENTT